MSRIGKQTIGIPDGVTVNIANGEIQVKGPKGNLTGAIPEGIDAKVEDGVLSFARPDDSKPARSLHGLARALANNMVTGVSQGFAKRLEIEGVGYRADVKGKVLNLLLGFSHPVDMPIPEEREPTNRRSDSSPQTSARCVHRSPTRARAFVTTTSIFVARWARPALKAPRSRKHQRV
jgi:ribosomal protein L6P/L9E